MKYTAFFISDGTGITAEALGQSLLSRFSDIEFDQVTLPYINTKARAEMAARRINQHAQKHNQPPVVVMSLVSAEYRAIIKSSQGFALDMFDAFLGPLEQFFGCNADQRAGSVYTINQSDYHRRIKAIHFALENDDGGRTHNYHQADVILVGVSRSGKTPTCLYLGMHYGLMAANYPITEDDFDTRSLPKALQPYRDKLFGLLIDPKRLASIRQERLANSRYASSVQCEFETRQVTSLFTRHKIPHLNSTHLSIEELATRIMEGVGIERRIESRGK